MSPQEALDKLLPAYEGYYDVNRDNVPSPFSAEAIFHSHTENYILVKAAKIAEIDSNEYIYFVLEENIDSFLLGELSSIAWNKGLEQIKPYSGHRNSDVTLVVISSHFNGDLKKAARKLKMSKNYMLGLYGWSNFKLCALNLETGKTVSNFHGRDISRLFVKLGLSSEK